MEGERHKQKVHTGGQIIRVTETQRDKWRERQRQRGGGGGERERSKMKFWTGNARKENQVSSVDPQEEDGVRTPRG